MWRTKVWHILSNVDNNFGFDNKSSGPETSTSTSTMWRRLAEERDAGGLDLRQPRQQGNSGWASEARSPRLAQKDYPIQWRHMATSPFWQWMSRHLGCTWAPTYMD